MGAWFIFHNVTQDVYGELPSSSDIFRPGVYPYDRNLDRRDEGVVIDIFKLLIRYNKWNPSDIIDAIGDGWMHIKYKDGAIIEYDV